MIKAMACVHFPRPLMKRETPYDQTKRSLDEKKPPNGQGEETKEPDVVSISDRSVQSEEQTDKIHPFERPLAKIA